MKGIFKFAFILFIVNFAAAAILAGMYLLTKPNIEAQEKMIQAESLKEVMPEAIGDRLEPVNKDNRIEYWRVFKGADPKITGYIFIAEKYGYSSVIQTMIGMKRDGTITGVRVLSQNETPGLGAKITEVLSNITLWDSCRGIFCSKKTSSGKISPYFTEQFKNMNARDLELSKNKVHAITGATISSKAVVDSIKQKAAEILNNTEK